MYIIGPVRTAHFGRCRSFPNRFRIRRKAAADLGGGYFFRSTPNLIAAITSISNAMVSAVLMRSPPLRGNNRTVLTGEPHHTRFALLCQFSAPPTGRLFCYSTFAVPPNSAGTSSGRPHSLIRMSATCCFSFGGTFSNSVLPKSLSAQTTLPSCLLLLSIVKNIGSGRPPPRTHA